MANAFTVEKQRRWGGPEGKSFLFVEGILVIDTTASGGAAAGDLPASLFKLTKIVGCVSIVNDGNDYVVPGSPDYTGASLLVGGGADGALKDLPNDTYRVKLFGT
jgi:hypothetical protein